MLTRSWSLPSFGLTQNTSSVGVPTTFAGIAIVVSKTPQTVLVPRLAIVLQRDTSLPLPSRTRHATFASNTRAAPEILHVQPVARSPAPCWGTGTYTEMFSFTVEGRPPTSTHRRAAPFPVRSTATRHGRASSILMEKLAWDGP